MRIAHATHSMAGSSGVQTYITTVSDVMQRTGHEVFISADEYGSGAAHARDLALEVVPAHDQLPADLDVAFVHSSVASHAVALARPGVPQVFIAHGSVFDNYLPPQIAGRVSAVVNLVPHAVAKTGAAAVELPSRNLTQPIDRTRFRDRNPIGAKPRRALILSNYLEGERLARVREACSLAGIKVAHVGATGSGVNLRPEDAINEADIVFGKGRAVVEAMACGRAAYVYDMWGGDGWVTPETYDVFAARGFGGVSLARDPSAAEIAAELGSYSPELGAWGAGVAITRHRVEDHVGELMALAQQASQANPTGSQSPRSEREELARLARQSWRHEGQAHVLSEQLKLQSKRLDALESELHTLRTSRSWRITAPLRRIRRKNP